MALDIGLKDNYFYDIELYDIEYSEVSDLERRKLELLEIPSNINFTSEIEKSNNKNFLFTLKERESKVNNHILEALDNFVIKYSKENNFELYHHRKLNKNMLKDNSFWSICLFEINFDCTDPWIEKRTTTIKEFNFNRIHTKKS